MLIYMKHPQHGRMPVYSASERDRAISFGWVVDEPKPIAEPITEPPKPTRRKGK